MFVTALLSFGVPFLISHLGVAAAGSAWLTGAVGASAATAITGAGTKVAGNVIQGKLAGLLHHLAGGGELTQEQRDWLAASQGGNVSAPRLGPVDASQPVTWTVPKA